MRNLTSAGATALNSASVPLVLFLEMGFSAVVRFNSSNTDIEFGGNVYGRTGSLGAIDPVRDSSGELSGLKFNLSGIPSENIALALGESVRNKSCVLRLGILDPVTHAVLEAPIMFSGVLDQMSISEGQGTSVIGITAIHIGQIYARPKPLQYTDGDQRRLFAGDTSLRFMVSQSQHKDVWPAASWGKQ